MSHVLNDRAGFVESARCRSPDLAETADRRSPRITHDDLDEQRLATIELAGLRHRQAHKATWHFSTPDMRACGHGLGAGPCPDPHLECRAGWQLDGHSWPFPPQAVLGPSFTAGRAEQPASPPPSLPPPEAAGGRGAGSKGPTRCSSTGQIPRTRKRAVNDPAPDSRSMLANAPAPRHRSQRTPNDKLLFEETSEVGMVVAQD